VTFVAGQQPIPELCYAGGAGILLIYGKRRQPESFGTVELMIARAEKSSDGTHGHSAMTSSRFLRLNHSVVAPSLDRRFARLNRIGDLAGAEQLYHLEHLFWSFRTIYER
jgi:hypothetical protein